MMLCTVQTTCTREGMEDAISFAQLTNFSTEGGKIFTQLLPFVTSPVGLKYSCLISICSRIWA